ncbi:zinc-binding dehydrogenase [Microbacterium sp. EST19A]|uniref:zinc-binding dehydrogenase n=1 Tax=Microbacterium sp. EST19A TaxID=2862681 RepID=UPI001CC14A85|nr:zinc-binding dehydrogenase [Microbacterium sp. EST19A]
MYENPAARSAALPASMRAAIWDGVGSPLVVEDVPVPRPRAGEVLIKVAACGVCHTDLHLLKGEVPFPAPAVLGHEVSGVVVELGDDLGDSGIEVGMPVVGAFIMPCGSCRQCLRGRDDLCPVFFEQNRVHGNLLDGTSRLRRGTGERISMYSMSGLAEYAVVPVSAVAVLPPEVPLQEAAILGCAVFTAFGATARGGLTSGDSVVVVAVGGVGSSIIQVASGLGASPIIAVDVDDDKLDAARALGADVVVNSTTQDALAAIRAVVPGGVDVAFEALGRPETFELAIAALAEGGRMVAVGIAAGAATAAVPITTLVRRGQSIVGSFGARTREELPKVVALAAEGGVDLQGLVTRRFSLESAQEAFDTLAAGRVSGRAIITMDGAPGEPLRLA